MNEEEFLKEHPSLVIPVKSGDTSPLNYTMWQMEKLLEIIYETQLDKAKVREAIDKLWIQVLDKGYEQTWEQQMNNKYFEELKKELGL